MKSLSSKPFLIAILSTIILLIAVACAIPVAPTMDESTEAVEEAAEEAAPEAAAEATAAPAEEEAVADEAAPEATAAPAEEPAADASASSATTFTIIPEQSEARFYIDEDLRGNPITVEGVSSALNGSVMIDPANPANTQIGTITIDSASFVTDSGRRDGAIQRFVLGSNSYPTITFVPTSIEGLPSAAAAGDTFEFQVTGDLTLKDQTRPETFAVSVTADSDTQVSGSASATIIYADYGIFIPDVPFIANVSDELILEFDFVAAP